MTMLLHHVTANTCAIRSECSTCAGNVPPMHPEWIGVDTDRARVQHGGACFMHGRIKGSPRS
jgi:hypothetical protein